MQTENLGTARIEPADPVIAGSFQTIHYTYVVGHPIDDTGFIKIVFRYAGDFGTPQFDAPQKPNYCSVTTTGDCTLQPRWDPKGHTRPWGKALFLKVASGYLDRGDTVHLIFGDRSHDSPGWRVQTFCEKTFEFKTLVDPIASYQFKPLPQSPTISIIPGPPARAVCIAPSEVRMGETFDYHLKLEDAWGNPTQTPTRLSHPGFEATGIQYLEATDTETNLAATSNPILVLEQPPSLPRFWADMHGQTEETIGSNSIEDYFDFARNMALLDMAGHQGNDFQITDDFWHHIKKVTQQVYEPGRFVTFPSYEWSGNTPLGGDRNVYFLNQEGNITRSSNELIPGQISVYPISATANDLFAQLKTQTKSSPFCVAHVGGRYADLAMHDEDLELAVEVHSAWGTFQWMVDDALERGYRIGICAGSDGHKCRPGASYPGASKFGSYGGLTCLMMPQLDRQHFYEALKARHFYATTGNRSLMQVQLCDSRKPLGMMGDIVEHHPDQEPVTLKGWFAGTAPVERLEICHGKQIIHQVWPCMQDCIQDQKPQISNRIKILWRGSQVRGRGRKTCWDGRLHLSDNQIQHVQPINFWNPDQPLNQIDRQHLAWKSITTGGVAGCILELENPHAGQLNLQTAQGEIQLPVEQISNEPTLYTYGGIDKQLEIYRLPPATQTCTYLSFDIPLNQLHSGDNPIYLRAIQEDGHMAWSSPVYVVL